MKVWIACLLLALLFPNQTSGEDTVAQDIGAHQLERLVELLTPQECEDLLRTLSHPEENIFQHVEKLSPENNQLHTQSRAKRAAASSAAGSEAQCRAALTDWLVKYGEQTYYDRLSRALQHIGRTDVAMEVGKNINQDLSLKLKRFVEDYHKYAQSLNIPKGQPKTADHQHGGQRAKYRKVRDVDWRKFDLIVERGPVSAYQKGPLVVLRPIFYGFLLGFGGSLLVALSILLITTHITQRNPHGYRPLVTSSSRS
ncbi:transmembrane and death domain protein 1 isoform X1 [Nelusetta ayraudi]|uniref:transmembrane and death domain protein 1 isoform X1 n=1 Tax=Nelusetta ayraudi TaxID=303726 RepID=UPI003F720779